MQTQGNSIKSEEEQKVSDQKFNLYFPLAEIKQFTFGIEDCEGKEEQLQHGQLEQQIKEVFFYDFEDPIADFLDSLSSIDVKIFQSEGLNFFCMRWPSLLFESRFSRVPINQFLTWLHWKHAFT